MRRHSALRSGFSTTPALVHEAFGRLVDADIPWNDRVHFFAVAANTMRRILVEHARRANRPKRGGVANKVTLDAALEISPATFHREPRLARAWLQRELRNHAEGPDGN
jgi:hypothetical protein